MSRKMYRLGVSENGRYLVQKDGKDTPFFYLADTALRLWQRSFEEDVALYLDNRVAKGFNVIHHFAIPVWFPGDEKNFYGEEPFINGDPTKLNPPYWDYVRYCIGQEVERGLYTCLVLGNPIKAAVYPQITEPQVAYDYAWAIADQLKDLQDSIIWAPGGPSFDFTIPGEKELGSVKKTSPDYPRLYKIASERLAAKYRPLYRAAAKGIADALKGRKSLEGPTDYSDILMTYYCPGISSKLFPEDEPWMSLRQLSAKDRRWYVDWYRNAETAWSLQPVKPALNLEAAYENSVLFPDEAHDGHTRTNAYDVRVCGYWSAFSGSIGGHNYGNRDLIGFYDPDNNVPNGLVPERQVRYWKYMLDDAGSFQLQYLKRLMEAAPLSGWVPDNSLILDNGEEPTSPEVYTNRHHKAAIRQSDNSLAYVYVPYDASVKVNLSGFRKKVNAWWYNPRAGYLTWFGEIESRTEETFQLPTHGEDNDWVLVLSTGDVPKSLLPAGK